MDVEQGDVMLTCLSCGRSVQNSEAKQLQGANFCTACHAKTLAHGAASPSRRGLSATALGLLIGIPIFALMVPGAIQDFREKQRAREAEAAAPTPPTAEHSPPPLPQPMPTVSGVRRHDEPADKSFPGTTPGMIYSEFESRGYSVRKDLAHKSVMCTKSNGETDFTLSIFGDWNAVYRVTFTATSTSPDGVDAAALNDMIFAASMPYDGAESDRAMSWVKSSLGQSTKAVFGHASFELYAPTQFGRSLQITPQ